MEKAKKKRMKRAAAWIAAASIVALLTALPLLAKSEPANDGPAASVLSAQVESGSIHQVINGGGTLSADAVAVKIPEGVKITGFLVKNGQHITAGTPVAEVDQASVLAAMSDVEETLDYLREKIEDAKDERVSSVIYATTGGRIKKVFADAGDSLQDIMLSHGALALLSVDGKMAVKLEVKSDIATGESVDVTITGGSTVSGRVESNINGEVVISIEDDGYAIGAQVQVAGLGTGELYVHNAWKATGYSGTISYVNVREEQTVSAGTALFNLTDTDYNGQWEYRMSQHQKYEELLQKLTVMYQSGTIDAPCDGVVSGVEEDSAYLLSAEEADVQAALLERGDMGTVRLMLLTSVANCLGGNYTNPDCNAGAGKHHISCIRASCVQSSTEGSCKFEGTHDIGCVERCNTQSNCENGADGPHKQSCYHLCTEASDPSKCPNASYGLDKHKQDCIHKCTKGTEENGANGCAATKNGKNHYLSCIESCVSAKTANETCNATGKHKLTCISSCEHASTTGVCKPNAAGAPHYNDCIESCTEKETCPATKHTADCKLYGIEYFTASAGKVTFVGTDLGVYTSNITYLAEQSDSGWVIDGKVNEELLISDAVWKLENPQGTFHVGDIVLSIQGYRTNQVVYRALVLYKAASTGGMSGGIPGGAGGIGGSMGGMGGMSGMTGGFSGNGNYNATVGKDEGLVNLEGYTLLTLLPQETMTVSIALDEQDISKVSVGMEATIKVDALRGRTYTAVISGIGFTGENDGGSSKFPVELTLEADQDMLDGMSTTARIVLETKEDIPVIPLAALNGDSVHVYVYTALDKETGEPTNPVNVEVGLSDGENAEILSGLNIGDKVYYHYYDVLELDTSA